ncbi:hypothetical protein ASE48_16185 [Mycobacterium sp. Root265]|uniref:hypothetical protein n=1 Tax=Mycobacterium sp. Root265 TaxID=1736504 RepID=UPI00070D27F8|nr:hypothetical protein [Mycobacterium sp. Root265]KRD05712.1 hypothetical protein ASE48_16185 [Mycobacterium sp. Root265]
MAKKKDKTPLELRGQLMLQIAAGRFFRTGVEINERLHRRTVYTNAELSSKEPVELPVGTVTASTERGEVSTVMVEATDRLEATSWGGVPEFLFATNGDDLIDDITYVTTFMLNRTFCRSHDQANRLITSDGVSHRRHTAANLFPGLFEPSQIVAEGDLVSLKVFMGDLIALDRDNFARVMRVIRNTVDATRTAIDDPTGAYTDIVAALESLGEDSLTTPATWDRYDSAKRKIIDGALKDVDSSVVERVRAAVLEADRAGLRRRFISSTLARVSPSYYRAESVKSVQSPRAAELERMLAIAYDIRSRRSHVLQDLGSEAWVFTDGAETTFEANFERILTLAGLWRLVRHVVRRFVVDAQKVGSEPWDYREALPGLIRAQLAPQYWIGQAEGFNVKSAPRWFNGAADALIAWLSDEDGDRFNLTGVIERIEQLVPGMSEGEARDTLVAIHVLWHEWLRPEDHTSSAKKFIERYGSCLDLPTPHAFAVGVLSNRELPVWSPDEWATMAASRHAARRKGKDLPLPAKVDALLQLEAAEQLEAAGRHEEAIVLAANAVEECPGDVNLIAWEERLQSGELALDFDAHLFLLGRSADVEGKPSSEAAPE